MTENLYKELVTANMFAGDIPPTAKFLLGHNTAGHTVGNNQMRGAGLWGGQNR